MTGVSLPVTLRDMAVQVGDVDLLRRRVLNVVGHELRTPVSTLSGLATELEACSAVICALVRSAENPWEKTSTV